MRVLLPGSPVKSMTPEMVTEEQVYQAQLLQDFRQGSEDEVIEFNQWMSTKDGKNRWHVDL